MLGRDLSLFNDFRSYCSQRAGQDGHEPVRPYCSKRGKRVGWVMDESNIDDEREALSRRRQEITRQLQALPAQDDRLDDVTLEIRREPLLRQIREIEQRLTEIDLDERSLRHMEGGE